MYLNNTVYIIPKADLWVLAIANSPVNWWYSWRATVHGKDEALRFLGTYVSQLPIPEPNEEQRIQTETAVRRLIAITSEQQGGRRALLDWLRLEFGIDKPSQKLQDAARLDADGFCAEVKKARGRKKPLSVTELKRLREEHAAGVVPLQTLAGAAAALEARVADLVNAAYGLTPEEIALMWQTAPPRMPGEWPQS